MPERKSTRDPNVTYSLQALQATHRDAAAMALARAFHQDPLFEFIAPNPVQRTQWLPVVMRESIAAVGLESQSRVVLSDTGRVVAAMVAGKYPPSLLSQLRQQLATILFPLPWVPRLGPLFRIFRYMDDWEQRHHPEPHHYVYLIGVTPEHQHRGLGRMMMRELIKDADTDRIPVYLETVRETNVQFYNSLGFRITDECRSHPQGPMAWMMLRDVELLDHDSSSKPLKTK